MLRTVRVFLLLAITLPALTGCLVRTHKVEKRQLGTPAMSATLEELVARINTESAKISSLKATVDIVTSAGGAKKGKVTEYQEIRGYVLVRKPSMLRMIGLFPVVRNRMFDMVSDGDKFRLSIPPKNKFIVGTNKVAAPSKEPLDNLRPNHIMDALLIREIDPKTEIAILENGYEQVKNETKHLVDVPTYVITVIHNDGQKWALNRRIHFSRTDLQPRKQILYNQAGEVITIATYENFSAHKGISFPNIIQIERPQEEYSIQLGVVKLDLNEPLKDDQFVLSQPAGALFQNLDNKLASPATAEQTKAVVPGGATEHKQP